MSDETQVVVIDGDEVTLRPGLRPGPDWMPVAGLGIPGTGGWEKRLVDGTVFRWITVQRRLEGIVWALGVGRPRVEAQEEPKRETQPGNRALEGVPWEDMTAEEKRLAVKLGLVTIKPPAPPPGPSYDLAERDRKRFEALVKLDRDPAFEEWAADQRDAFAETYAERRAAAEWLEQRGGPSHPVARSIPPRDQ